MTNWPGHPRFSLPILAVAGVPVAAAAGSPLWWAWPSAALAAACFLLLRRTRADHRAIRVLEQRIDQLTRQRDEARLAAGQAERAKAAFIAHLNHEIRTPMTAILGFADMLVNEEGLDRAPEQRRNAMFTIQRSGEQLLSTVNDLLEIAGLEAGDIRIHRDHFDPRALVHEVRAAMLPRARHKGLGLRVAESPDLPATVCTDPIRLKQILTAIVDNAIKFTESGGVDITLGFEPLPQPRLILSIADTGIGLDPRHADQVFRPFFQVDGSMSRRFGGAGLGLPIAQRLAARLGGEITFDSTPGAGTTFRISIDAGLDAPLPAGAPEPLSHHPSPDIAGLRILLAEDGEDNRRLVSHHLQRAGAVVDTVPDGRAALQAVLEHGSGPLAYDLVLMDMEMPVMDGYEATRILRARVPSLPVIALTAHATPDDRRQCIEAGCADFLTKPVDRAALVRACELARRRARITPGVFSEPAVVASHAAGDHPAGGSRR